MDGGNMPNEDTASEEQDYNQDESFPTVLTKRFLGSNPDLE